MLAVSQVGDGAGHLEDAVVGAGGKSQAVGDQFQHAVAGVIQFAVFLDKTGRHLGVAVDFRTLVALQLDLSRAFHPPGNLRGAFRLSPVGQVTVFDRRHLDVDINAVQKRP